MPRPSERGSIRLNLIAAYVIIVLMGGIFSIPAAITLVQQAVAASANKTTNVVTIATPASGNALCATVGINGATTTVNNVSGGGVTWTQAATGPGGSTQTEIWCGPNSSGSGTSITVTLNAKADHRANVSEWSGVAKSSIVDVAGSPKSGTSANPATNAASTATAETVLIAAAQNGAATYSSGPTNSFIRMTQVGAQPLESAYRIVSSTGSYQTDWTMSGSSAWATSIVAIKGTAPGVPAPSFIRRGFSQAVHRASHWFEGLDFQPAAILIYRSRRAYVLEIMRGLFERIIGYSDIWIHTTDVKPVEMDQLVLI